MAWPGFVMLDMALHVTETFYMLKAHLGEKLAHRVYKKLQIRVHFDISVL